MEEEPQPTPVRHIVVSQPSSHLMRSWSGAGKDPVFLLGAIAVLRIILLLRCYCTVTLSHLARGKHKYIIWKNKNGWEQTSRLLLLKNSKHPPVQLCLGDRAQDALLLASASLNSFARLGEHQLHCSPQQFLSVKLLANAPCSYAPAPGQQHGCM